VTSAKEVDGIADCTECQQESADEIPLRHEAAQPEEQDEHDADHCRNVPVKRGWRDLDKSDPQFLIISGIIGKCGVIEQNIRGRNGTEYYHQWCNTSFPVFCQITKKGAVPVIIYGESTHGDEQLNIGQRIDNSEVFEQQD
jgi:hypothetical protein